MAWWFPFPTKRELKKIIGNIKDSFKHQDDKIEVTRKEFVSKKEVELMIREAILNLRSELDSGLKSGPSKPNQTHYAKVMLRKAQKTRPEALKTAIRGYISEGMRTIDIYKLIVEEKRLISKTQFYHYLSLVRNEHRTEVRTEPRNRAK